MKKAVIGLLPLYIELYDERTPELRPRINAFHDRIANELSKKGIDVVRSEVCRVKDEFERTISNFEKQNVDAIVTLHLAYSPSLESCDALKNTNLPIIILDTTETFVFDEDTPAAEILYNHGIHGVQDMCNLLHRNKKKYVICAGHLFNSNVLDRVVSAVRGAVVAKAMKTARIGKIGAAFDGMGDFAVSPEELKKTIGFDVVSQDEGEGERLLASVTQGEIDAQYRADETAYVWDSCVTRELYDKSERVCQAIRKWVQCQRLTGYTINFLESYRNKALPTMPFLETSRSMASGVGYAGEGDVLTAALIGALLTTFPDTTFSEMFCPNWAGESIFLSHMGEVNLNCVAGKPLLTEKDFPYTDAYNPTVAYGTLKGGPVTLTSLAPAGDGQYNLILCKGNMLDKQPRSDISMSVNGWFKPNCTAASFLEQFSTVGGIHHIGLVYGDAYESLRCFGEFIGFHVTTIQ